MCSTVAEDPRQALTAARILLSDTHHLVEDLTHEQATEALEQLRALSAQCDALTLAVVGKVDADGTYALDGHLSPRSWVQAVAHQTAAEAARTVRTARVLRCGVLPNTSAALAAGAISGRHAAVIADGITGAPLQAVALIEPDAVATAAAGDLRATANVMAAFQHALDPDQADAKALRRYERAGISLAPLLDGGFAIAGTADETTGATVTAALDHAEPLVTGDQRTPARRRLDALLRISQHWLDTAPPHPDRTARRTSTTRARLVVTLDANGLAGGTSPGGTLTWAGPIAASTAQRLGCSSDTTFVHLDHNGEVVEAGTSRRYFTDTQKLAIIARDGDTCPAPYCDRPATWSDGHHLLPVSHGGTTTISNGALPCEGHHIQLHEGHWTLHRLPDGRHLMQHPDGRTLGPEPPPPGHNRPPPEPPAP
jgi:hypothetical protein